MPVSGSSSSGELSLAAGALSLTGRESSGVDVASGTGGELVADISVDAGFASSGGFGAGTVAGSPADDPPDPAVAAPAAAD